MAVHYLEPERATLHGQFSRDWPPVLTIDPGDTVVYRTLDAGWNLRPNDPPWGPEAKFQPRIDGRDDGHSMCGSIAVRGSEPGMTCGVEID